MAEHCKEINIKCLNLTKIKQKKANQILLPSIDSFDSPVGYYYAGTQYFVQTSHLKQYTNTSYDALNTSTAASLHSPFSSAKKTIPSTKHFQTLIYSNKKDVQTFSDQFKQLENTKIFRKRKYQNKQQLNVPSSETLKSLKQKDEDHDSSDEDEYSIWDNSQAENIGIDCENFMNKEGKEYTFYQLYRVRQQFYQKKHMPSHISIDEVYTIADHYNQRINKTELFKQQEYLEQTYFNSFSTPTNNKSDISSLRYIKLKHNQQEIISKNPFKQYQLASSRSVDSIEKSLNNAIKQKQFKFEDPLLKTQVISSPKTYYLNQKKFPLNSLHQNSSRQAGISTQQLMKKWIRNSNKDINTSNENNKTQINSIRIKQDENRSLKTRQNVKKVISIVQSEQKQSQVGYQQQQIQNNSNLNSSINQNQKLSQSTIKLTNDLHKKLIPPKGIPNLQEQKSRIINTSIFVSKSAKDLESPLDSARKQHQTNSSSKCKESIYSKQQSATQYQDNIQPNLQEKKSRIINSSIFFSKSSKDLESPLDSARKQLQMNSSSKFKEYIHSKYQYATQYLDNKYTQNEDSYLDINK